MQLTLKRQPWRLLHKVPLLDTFCHRDFSPIPSLGDEATCHLPDYGLLKAIRTNHFSNDRFPLLLCNFGSSVCKPILNPTTMITFPPCEATHVSLILVAGRTQVVLLFSRKPLLPWCPSPTFASNSARDGCGSASLMTFLSLYLWGYMPRSSRERAKRKYLVFKI